LRVGAYIDLNTESNSKSDDEATHKKIGRILPYFCQLSKKFPEKNQKNNLLIN